MTNIDALADALVAAHIDLCDAIRTAGRKPEDNRHAVRLGDLAEAAIRIAAGEGSRAEALLRLDRIAHSGGRLGASGRRDGAKVRPRTGQA